MTARGGLRAGAALVALILLLTACSGNNAPELEHTKPVQLSGSIWAMVVIPYGQFGLEDNATTRWLEEQTGVHVDFWEVPADEARAYIAVSMASYNLPDVFLNCPLEQFPIYKYDLLLPLEDLIERHGYYLPMALEELEEDVELRREFDGEIYILPAIDPDRGVAYSRKLWINEDMLGDLQLEMPQDPAQFHDTLAAMRDAYGIAPLTSNAIPYYDSLPILINTFLPFDPDQWGMGLEGERVVSNLGDERYREALEYLGTLYNDGLISPSLLEWDYWRVKDAIDEGTAGVVAGWQRPVSASGANYEPLPPLVGPDGQRRALTRPYYPGGGGLAITELCDDPDLVMQWADYLYAPDISLSLVYGPPGVGWRPAKKGETGLDGKPALWSLIEENGTGGSDTAWGKMGIYYLRESWQTGRAAGPEDTQYLLREISREIYEPWGIDGYILPPLSLSPDRQEEANEILSRLQRCYEDSLGFVTGERNLNWDWPEHLYNLEELGNDWLLEIYQEAL